MQDKDIEEFLVSNGVITYIGNIALLGIHMGLLLMFYWLQVEIMVFVNIGSVLLYLCLFFLISRNLLLYFRLISLEIFIHMVLATLCMGWNYGFQFYCIFLIPVTFYCDYLYKKQGTNRVHVLASSIFVSCCFIAEWLYLQERGAIYEIHNRILVKCMYVINLITMFTFLIGYLFSYQKLTLRAEYRLKQQAEIDLLTQLPNRRRLENILRSIFDEVLEGRENLAVAILDIDDFKMVNDQYGHLAGDYILCQVADVIRAQQSETMNACRWGGEEFLIISTGESAYQHLLERMEILRKTIEQAQYEFEGQEIRITVTVGAAMYRKDIRRVEELTKRADQNLYKGKNTGKNQVVS